MKWYCWLLVLFLLPSCNRTPEHILSWTWGLNVGQLDHTVESFEDGQYGFLGTDVTTKIRMRVILPEKAIQKLILKGAQDLPITQSPSTKKWLEQLSGIKEADNGVYYYEQGDTECKFLIYDRDSQTLFYYLSII